MRSLASVLFLLSCAVSALGQGCAPGQTFLKNDNLATIPGTASISIIQGFCEGEAAGCVFDVSSIGAAVKVNLCAIGYINAVSASGIQAAGNLQIFDGITFPGGNPVLGPQVFDFTTAGGAAIGYVSSGINTVDIAQFNVTITSGKLVVAFTMDFNPQGGTCAGGYQTNFATDNATQFAFTCNPAITPPQKNLINILGQGWRDASTATVSGVPLCPIFYAGNWLIRACVEPVSGPSTLSMTFPLGSNVVTPATTFVLFNAPSNLGDAYFATPSLAPGPIGSGLPVDPFDPLVQLRLVSPSALAGILFGFDGIIGPAGTAGGQIAFPPLNAPTPFSLHFGFLTFNGSGVTGISQPAVLTVQ